MLQKHHEERLDGPDFKPENAYLEAGQIDEKKLIRRIDLRILPWLSLLYLLSFLDRTNIGNAQLFGLSADIGITSTQYSACLAVFFAFYVLLEVPSNVVMKMWRPSMWLPLIMIAWGAVMIGMGFVKDFKDLLIARIFLGITEAGLFPGVSYFLTLWYRRYEVNLRIAVFFSAATIAGAFGGLLARLINLMDGSAGYEGWRWIFILEGIATVVIAAASFWMLYDYPDTAKFLTPTEKLYMQERIKFDSDGLSSENKKKFIWQGLKDWKIWVFAIMYQGGLMPVYSFSLFSPTLTANLGYSAARAQLLSVPAYVLAAICTIVAGYLSDRFKKRGVFVLFFSALGALGFLLLISNDVPGVNFLGLFLAAAGVYPLIPLVVSFAGNNQGGAVKRGVGMAVVISMGNAGGCISSFIYPRKDSPRYYVGHGVNLAYCVMTFVLALFMMVYLGRENRKKERLLAERGKPWSAEDKAQYAEEGDDAPFFMYTI